MTDVDDFARQIDLLVDGELDEISRRDLLLHLDRESGAWRRCALAFLEAQTWHRELDEMRGAPERAENLAESSPRAEVRPASRRSVQTQIAPRLANAKSIGHRPTRSVSHLQHHKVRTITSALAIVAGLMAAFVLGAELQRVRLPGDDSSGSSATRLAEGGQTATPQTDSSIESSAAPLENWTMNAGESIPSDVLESLERLGHRVERHQEFWPYNFDDGRRFLVPVERVEVRYVGNSFQ